MPTLRRMELGLYDARGQRKYLTTAERTAFLTAAEEAPREVRTQPPAVALEPDDRLAAGARVRPHTLASAK